MLSSGHIKITNYAIGKRDISPYFLNIVNQANISSDSMQPSELPYALNFPPQHFTKNDGDSLKSLKLGADYIAKLRKLAVDELIEASNSCNAIDLPKKNSNFIEHMHTALISLGRMFHAQQDFYSHSNWENLTGPEIRVWNESPDKPNIDAPKALKTCTPGKVSRYTANIFKNSSDPEFYEKYLKPDIQLDHADMNKDYPNSFASKAFLSHTIKDYHFPGKIISGYDLAFDDATEHTRREWMNILKTLKANTDSKTFNKVTDILRSYNPDIRQADIQKEITLTLNHMRKQGVFNKA